eukprot:COSAG05_NODE_4957_length_1312_cov_1.196208_1_plen_70_part_00
MTLTMIILNVFYLRFSQRAIAWLKERIIGRNRYVRASPGVGREYNGEEEEEEEEEEEDTEISNGVTRKM